VPGSRNRVAEDPHHVSRSPSVAGLGTRCRGRSNYDQGDATNSEVQDAGRSPSPSSISWRRPRRTAPPPRSPTCSASTRRGTARRR
jgi:hypothetical protein